MLKILHLIDSTGRAGAETVLLNIVKGLDRSCFHSHILLPDKGWLYGELQDAADVDLSVISARGRFNLGLLKRLVKYVNQHHIQIIHSHLFGSALYASMVGLMLKVPVVCTFHGTFDFLQRDALLCPKSWIINSGARKLVFVSHYLKRYYIEKARLKHSKCEVVHNGIAFRDLAPQALIRARKIYGLGENEFIVGCIGNVKPVKGYDVLLRAAKTVVDNENKCRFVIAGAAEGFYFDSLLRLRDRLGLQAHVRFLGYEKNPANLYGALNLFILPSITEGFSLATIEAMGHGLPVIVTKSGGPEEIVFDGENGLVANIKNVEDLADSILRLIRDKKLSAALAKEGKRSVVERFGLDKMIAKYQGIYNNVKREERGR